MSVIPALGRLRQEDLKLEANLGFIVRLCAKKEKRKKPKVGENILPRVFITKEILFWWY
jgi:hypothetical protein